MPRFSFHVPSQKLYVSRKTSGQSGVMEGEGCSPAADKGEKGGEKKKSIWRHGKERCNNIGLIK